MTNNIIEDIKCAIKTCLQDQDTKSRLTGALPRTHKNVESFQVDLGKAIADNLRFGGYCKDKGGNIEHKLFEGITGWENTRDSADIWFELEQGPEIIIEIDATRADQVAKKMLSRFCYFSMKDNKQPIIYIALLYQGTSSMNPDECKKYFRMGAEVLKRINNQSILIGWIIGEDQPYVFTSSEDSKVRYSEDAVSEREAYIDYLVKENIKSVNNYLFPINWLEQHFMDFKSRTNFLKKLLSPNSKERDLIEEKSKKTLSKDQLSYWNKYIKYLKENLHFVQ